ncbi:LAME_0F17766g1_1 [Lachancea meyersii CBS 8951]|uniref:LAME_0F17766g1_1 n=1 Tax=Lachancea meyersii CBS 8951 TaxID=1266667 RepID=A0A1G4K065_9SACH|nr:LAME_0F17766g1_1 [Lachancea meyersii CBS 8951]
MLLGPLKLPQVSNIPFLRADNNDTQNGPEKAVQTLHLPYSNCLVVLTTKQILVYNYKPMALVSSFVRSSHSLEKYGENQSVHAHEINAKMFQDLTTETDLNYMDPGRGKVTFYVVSSLNFVFVFEIMLNSNPVSIYKETGIPILDINKVDHDFGQDLMNNTEDDDTLTVFDKKDSHKVIQNGYAVDKQQGFLHFFTKAADTLDEIPIKKVELRLKVMFSFGRPIVDLVGFCDTDSTGEAGRHEYLMILFPHRVHILVLHEFKMKDNILIDVLDGRRLLYCQKSPCVVSQNSEGEVFLKKLDISQREAYPKRLDYDADGPLVDVYANGNVLSFVHDLCLVLYDLESEKTIKRVRSHINLTCGGLVNDEISILLTRNGMKLLTSSGNCIVSTFDEDEVTEEESDLPSFSSFATIGDTIVASAPDGKLAKWDLWSEVITPFNNFRTSKPLILQSENNDLLIFAPTSDTSSNVPFQVLKLPTQTINNHIPLVRTNGPMTMLAAFVSNKNILLIHNLITNAWHSFPDLALIDIQWLGSEYLFCRSLDDDMKEQLRCYHFPLQGSLTSNLSDQLIWSFAVSLKTEIKSIHANTLSRYKLLRVKSKSANTEELENMFKTGEILIQDAQGDLRTIDIVSKISADESIGIKVFHQHPAERIFDNEEAECKWILSHNGGYFVHQRNQILKRERVDGRTWKASVALDNVERILDVIDTGIFVVQEDKVVVHNLEDLWNDEDPVAIIEIAGGDYPVVVSPEAAIVHSVQFVLSNGCSKIVPRQAIYLDQVLESQLNAGRSYQEIDARYHSLHHYKFSLEKILSGKILSNEPLSHILSLIDHYDQGPKHSGRLEIISNCLRKIEVEHWDYLFKKLDQSPRDLLLQCIEHDEARVLGVLLMVFLNYDGSKQDKTSTEPIEKMKSDNNGNNKKSKNKNKNKNKNKKNKKNQNKQSKSDKKDENDKGNETETEICQTEAGSIATILNDEELMLQVLRILVNTASSTDEREEAREFWDMSFQLVRFIHALDEENKTSLIQRAVQTLS